MQNRRLINSICFEISIVFHKKKTGNLNASIALLMKTNIFYNKVSRVNMDDIPIGGLASARILTTNNICHFSSPAITQMCKLVSRNLDFLTFQM